MHFRLTIQPPGISRRAAPWLTCAALLAFLLCLSAFVPASPPLEQPQTLSGNGLETTSRFHLQGGYYRIVRRVTSSSAADCFFESELQAADGDPRGTIDGPAVPAASTWTWQTDLHSLPQGWYRLKTLAPCRAWQVSFSPQRIFDAESQPIEVTSWRVGQGDVQVALFNLTLDDMSLDGWKLDVHGRPVSLPGRVPIPFHGTLIVHLRGGQASSGSDLFLNAPQDLLDEALQAPINLAMVDGQGLRVSEFRTDRQLRPSEAPARAVSLLGSQRVSDILGKQSR